MNKTALKIYKKDKREKVDWKKYSEEDRKFLINVSLINRNFLTDISVFIYLALISVSGFLISIYSIGISIAGINDYFIYTGIGLLILIIFGWILTMKYHRKLTKIYIPLMNKQYQDIHKSFHPELFKGKYWY